MDLLRKSPAPAGFFYGSSRWVLDWVGSVKSYLGSRGVVAEHLIGEAQDEKARKRYALLNRREVRGPVIKRYGYRAGQVELRLSWASSPGRASTRRGSEHGRAGSASVPVRSASSASRTWSASSGRRPYLVYIGTTRFWSR